MLPVKFRSITVPVLMSVLTVVGSLNAFGPAMATPVLQPSSQRSLMQLLHTAQRQLGQLPPVTPSPTSGSGSSTTTIPTPSSTNPNPSPTGASGTTTSATQSRFSCQMLNGQYTVTYLPQSQPNMAYAWAIPQEMGGNWSPERRCGEISRRLEFYRPDGLIELQTGQENGYNTVCVTTQKTPGCRIVFTVPNGQDPITTRDRVFQNISMADSGQQTQGVTTLTSNQSGSTLSELAKLGQSVLGKQGGSVLPKGNALASGIDLRPFLDKADGGTATKLQGGVPTQKTR